MLHKTHSPEIQIWFGTKNAIKMNVKIFILIFFINSLLYNDVNCQPTFQLHLNGKITLDASFHGIPIRLNKGLGLINTDNMELSIFDLDGGKLIKEVRFEKPSSFAIAPYAWQFLMRAGEDFFLLDDFDDSIFVFDAKGKFLGKKKLKTKYKGVQYYVSRHGLDKFNPVYNDQTRRLFVSISPEWKGYRNKKKFTKGGIKKYSTNGLIGEFNLEGELQNVYGKYDSVYLKRLFLSYLDGSPFDKFENNGVVYSCQLSNDILIEDLQTHQTRKVGKPGRYIKKHFDELPEIQSIEDRALYENSFQVESPFNWSIHTTDRYLLRIYTTGIKDTVTVSEKDMTFTKEYINGEIKGCFLPPLSVSKRLKLLSNKPFFIQVYDVANNFNLLYDGPIDLEFPLFLGAAKNEFYFFGGGKQKKILSYTLVPDSAKLN